MLSTPILNVEGDLCLGNHPVGLSALTRAILEKSTPAQLTDRLEVSLQAGWYDLTLLTYLAQILNIARDHFGQINLYLHKASDSKFFFLWRCGFWNYVRANRVGSTLYCHPNNWERQPNIHRARYVADNATFMVAKYLIDGRVKYMWFSMFTGCARPGRLGRHERL